MHSFSHFQTRLHLSFYKFFKATEWLPWSSIWNLRVHPCLSHGALWRAAEQAAVEEAGSVGEGGWWGSSAKSTHAVLLRRQTPLLCGRSPWTRAAAAPAWAFRICATGSFHADADEVPFCADAWAAFRILVPSALSSSRVAAAASFILIGHHGCRSRQLLEDWKAVGVNYQFFWLTIWVCKG